MNDSSDEKPEKKLKQTTMGNFTTKQPKDKEKKEEATTTINRRTRFNQNNADNWTSGWSTGWDSWRVTDGKKKDTEEYRAEYPRTRFNQNNADNWTSGWSTGWDSWRVTDGKKKDTEEYRAEYPRTRFNQNNADNWTSGWSTGWDSWRVTDGKKKDTEEYRAEYPDTSWRTKDGKKKDLEEYRAGYPGKNDDPKLMANLKFYMNEIKSYPDRDFIDNIHKKWWGDYKLLERNPNYIGWLFPIRESGMNVYAQELQKHEAQEIIADRKAHRRALKSYKMMLDFYGMKITDEVTGAIRKTDNWKERFSHLNSSNHNYFRITRILKCLGELGYEHMKVKFLEFVIDEVLEKKTLKNCYKSCKDYWVETLRNDGERKHIQEYMKKVEEGYESGGDPEDDYNVNWDEDMEDESQEMKNHSNKIASDSEEEKQNVAKKGSDEDVQDESLEVQLTDKLDLKEKLQNAEKENSELKRNQLDLKDKLQNADKENSELKRKMFELQRKTYEMENNKNCVICFVETKNSIFEKCGHGACCMSCAEQMLGKCPVCRLDKQKIRKVFL